ncbi:MAG: PAS domain-containing sensor histidine kinase [Rhodospirillum sp.]|nr:PAS domain-containing sensor histidine kinase [Rhodospirillum sp.]MCF8490199.1 PAS domain-containing sensor histidine kinase [Rhodospirillum sp.]MCF8500343.1 PAS domain-containing sensor histidine kinase [Rhodospirillum sp.]
MLESPDSRYIEPEELSSLERREQRFALAMMGVNDGLWDWNLDRDEVYVSPRAEEIINIPASELAKTSWVLISYIHPQDLPEFRRRIVAHIKGESAWFECEYRLEDPNGRARWVLQRGLALRDGNNRARRMAGSLTDITVRKEAELRLLEAKALAEAAAQTKSDFLAHMSHELRTPLNAIIGFADMIRSEVQGPLDHPYYPEYVDNIHRSGLHLLALINDVLDTAKIEAGRFELDEEVVDLIEVVREVTDLLMPRSKRQGVLVKEIFPTYLPGLRGDARRVKQVLLNLVTNAVKFSKPGGEVRIRIFLDGPKGLIIRVSDQGVGMNPADIPKVLEAFGQVHHETAKDSEGTGLGLPLSKALVELHGGKLSIKSAPGRGTIVTVTLPPDRVIIA